MKVANKRLYSTWIREKRSSIDVKYISWAMRVAVDVEFKIEQGMEPKVACLIVLEAQPSIDMSEMMLTSAKRFLKQVWKYGYLLGVENEDSQYHSER